MARQRAVSSRFRYSSETPVKMAVVEA